MKESKKKKGLLDLSSDSSVNIPNDYFLTPKISNFQIDSLFTSRKQTKEMTIKSARNPLLLSLKSKMTSSDERNDLITKLKQENTELLLALKSKDKEIQNLIAVNNQIIKAQESKNEV
jgi:hypothetical protein